MRSEKITSASQKKTERTPSESSWSKVWTTVPDISDVTLVYEDVEWIEAHSNILKVAAPESAPGQQVQHRNRGVVVQRLFLNNK